VLCRWDAKAGAGGDDLTVTWATSYGINSLTQSVPDYHWWQIREGLPIGSGCRLSWGKVRVSLGQWIFPTTCWARISFLLLHMFNVFPRVILFCLFHSLSMLIARLPVAEWRASLSSPLGFGSTFYFIYADLWDLDGIRTPAASSTISTSWKMSVLFPTLL
jgi:hypothetical protein